MALLGIGGLIGSILAIIVGLLVLIFPKFLRIAVGAYFVIIGLLGFIGYFM